MLSDFCACTSLSSSKDGWFHDTTAMESIIAKKEDEARWIGLVAPEYRRLCDYACG